jgi:hypothetical protein
LRQAYATGRINQVAIIIFNIKIDIHKHFHIILCYMTLLQIIFHYIIFNVGIKFIIWKYFHKHWNWNSVYCENDNEFIWFNKQCFINILSIAISYNQLMIKKRIIHAFFIQLKLNLIKKKKRVQGKFYLNYFQYQLRSEKTYK